VRELSLCNARLHLAVHEGPLARLGRRDDAGAELLRAAPPPACPAIVFLRLAGFQVSDHSLLLLRYTKMIGKISDRNPKQNEKRTAIIYSIKS
jgi:hypothetical protein